VLIHLRISCFAAGTYDICLAISIQRPSWKDAHVSIDGKLIEAKQSTSLYDMDFTRLPTFDKHWATAHTIALALFSTAAATSTVLLWQTPCSDSTRKPLMELSVNCFNHFPSITNLLLVVVQAWLQRITGTISTQGGGLPRFMYIMLQLYFVTAGLGLGLSVYDAPNTSYGLVMVKFQTVATA
jgi:hypothetical protein